MQPIPQSTASTIRIQFATIAAIARDAPTLEGPDQDTASLITAYEQLREHTRALRATIGRALIAAGHTPPTPETNVAITITPTTEFTTIYGANVRRWHGATAAGTPIDAYVAVVATPTPLTADPDLTNTLHAAAPFARTGTPTTVRNRTTAAYLEQTSPNTAS